MIDPEILENFERAFSTNSGSCRASCACGKEFYNPDGGWTWDEGELEKLEKNPDAVCLDYSVGYIAFEGKLFVMDCECWKPRAEHLIAFITAHGSAIAAFLNAEKKRIKGAAETLPQVDS